MFTGIIEELGTVASIEQRSIGARLRVNCYQTLENLQAGGSIAVNGVCLTALDVTSDSFDADLAPETLSRSNLGALVAGYRVNLERPVTLATLFAGHIVQGHVDATGEIVKLEPVGEGAWLTIKAPSDLDRYLVHKGSVALDGISLTIAALEPGPLVSVAVIPHTLQNTTLGSARIGGQVNIEADILAKHVEKLLNHITTASGGR